MKKLSLMLAVMLIVTLFAGSALADWTPTKPITIMNYVKAGGGMDIATRKFAELAAKYTDATIIVDNKTGAGGLTCADYILSQPADGYLVFATTVSYVDTVLSNEEDVSNYIWGFEWIDDIMADPYCVIVKKDSDWTLDALIADAQAEEQIWAGPAAGGSKHIAAIQFCNALGMEITWLPKDGGPDAMMAVLSDQAVASCGNPGDVEGRELRHLVIATKEKLATYPDVPNFAELGHPELDELSMWRGYAVKAGTPAEFIEWWQDLCQKVTEDPEWIEFFNSKSIVVHNKTSEEFLAELKGDMAAHLEVLKGADLVSADYTIE
ncbi:MAG: tripartite tricarboxylate transporter substrate binding protein [Clostridia bacterium]|nr:tripartite tricarboxylate transporter substrate binding protein [Clostridia bacterium]